MANYKAGLRTKEKILAESKKLFYEKGYNETSLMDICNATGIRLGNLHYHFPNKSDISKTIYFEIVDYLQRQVITLFPDEEELVQLVISLTCHQRLLFQDANYRRFSLQHTKESMVNISIEEYRNIVPMVDHFLSKKMSDIEIEFTYATFSGADIKIEQFINDNIDRLTYEKAAKLTNHFYLAVTENKDLMPQIEYGIKLVRNLIIENDMFDIVITRLK